MSDSQMPDTVQTDAQATEEDRLHGPASGTRLGPGVQLFHDLVAGALDVGSQDGAHRIRAVDCVGNYLSLAVDASLDPEVCGAGFAGIEVRFRADTPRPMVCNLRLNVDHAGGRATLHDTIIVDQGQRSVRFDTGSILPDAAPPKAVWVDVILSDSRDCDVTVGDLVAAPFGFETA